MGGDDKSDSKENTELNVFTRIGYNEEGVGEATPLKLLIINFAFGSSNLE